MATSGSKWRFKMAAAQTKKKGFNVYCPSLHADFHDLGVNSYSFGVEEYIYCITNPF